MILYAIDNPSTRDRDDAIGLSDDGKTLVVGVARFDLPVDRVWALLERPETLYRADGTHVPMLDEDERAASLRGGDDNRLMLIEVPLHAPAPGEGEEDPAGDPDGPAATILFTDTGRVRVLSYADAVEPTAPEPLRALYDALTRRPRQEYHLEDGWALIEGQQRLLRKSERNAGFVLVAEAMLRANRAVARRMARGGIPGLFRTHAALGERAAYSPHASEHAALGFRVYTHATSPLRRFADLYNQAQYVAYIMGRPSGLPSPQEVADAVNRYHRQMLDEQGARYEAWADESAARKLATKSPQALARDRLFLHALKAADTLTPALACAVNLRIEEGALTMKEAAYLLFERGWMRHAILGAFPDTVSLFNLAAQCGYGPVDAPPEFSFVERRIECRARLGSLVAEAVGDTKAEAQRAACEQLAAAVASSVAAASGSERKGGPVS